MNTGRQPRDRSDVAEGRGVSIVSRTVAVALIVLVASSVFAQDPDRGSFVPDIVKQVFIDPTTYVPAIVAWKATRLDWGSSQVFFQNGYVEKNPRFTVSGRAGDTAIGYAAGNRQILTDALANLELSLINNVSERVFERLLVSRYPNQRKLLRAVGWIERGAMASLLTYRQSAGHFRQWKENERLAGQLGY
ncbi:MAG TPA: hypothetical protein VM818_20540 [Vicinamibacterales bacterium]|nr:hypothetical protein [Vicinamibacterales bacterium]